MKGELMAEEQKFRIPMVKLRNQGFQVIFLLMELFRFFTFKSNLFNLIDDCHMMNFRVFFVPVGFEVGFWVYETNWD